MAVVGRVVVCAGFGRLDLRARTKIAARCVPSRPPEHSSARRGQFLLLSASCADSSRPQNGVAQLRMERWIVERLLRDRHNHLCPNASARHGRVLLL